MKKNTTSVRRPRSVPQALALAALLVLVAAFLMNQSVIAFLAGVGLLLIGD